MIRSSESGPTELSSIELAYVEKGTPRMSIPDEELLFMAFVAVQ
jgi:hypothetical protein